MKTQLVIGLTGGIGSGKTTVANLFASYKVKIIDADIVARQIVAPHSQALKQIVDCFGSHLLQADQSLNRSQLRQLVFSDPAAKKKLEAITHPLIFKQILQQLATSDSIYTILVVPLLIESKKYQQIVDRVLVVDAPPKLQISRVKKRDNSSEQQVKNIINSQIQRQQRLKQADDIILNAADVAHLTTEVAKLHHFYLQIAAGKRA